MEFQPSKVPLRSSSVLINGVAKLYSIEVNSLLRECYEMDMEMAIRKTRKVNLDAGSNESFNVFNVAKEHSILPVSHQEHNEEYSDSEETSGSIMSIRKRRQSTSNIVRNEKRICSGSSIDPAGEIDQSIEDILINQVYANGHKEMLIGVDLPITEKNKQTHEKGTQSNKSFINSRPSNINNRTFDEHLPFGFVMIYDNYNDRLPSKIIYSSFNSNVKDL